MRKVVVISMISLDGVLQAPGAPTEDTSGGFEYGGWTASYEDEVLRQSFDNDLKPADYLLGRKTFEIWERYWPEHEAAWPGINTGTKYVMSATRHTSVWRPTIFIGDVAAVREIKQGSGPDLQVWGSSELIQLLLANDLVDELRLKIFPLTLGRGKKLFGSGTIPAAFKLKHGVVSPSGVIISTYIRNGAVTTGTVGQ